MDRKRRSAAGPPPHYQGPRRCPLSLFHQYPHPANFVFGDRYRDGALWAGRVRRELRAESAGGVHRLRLVDPARWPEEPEAPWGWPPPSAAGAPVARLVVTAGAGMRLYPPDGGALLEAEDGGWLGASGDRWLFRFRCPPGARFYGLGEKHTPFERAGRGYWFRNTDVWLDHPRERVRDGDYDPDYLSVPYLVVRQGRAWLGLLVDSAYPAFVVLATPCGIPGGAVAPPPAPEILLGADGGPPSLFVLEGPSLAELTRRFQMLTGPAPLPPLWSLGYHQSRWGYRGAEDLEALAARFERHRFPVDGLWLDIDYMDGFRVFTFDRRHLPDPAATVAALQRRGFRVVPILDPGVKREPGYGVYDSGRKAGVFCRNPAGGEFAGLVWPGLAVFPDFTRADARRWWAGHARRFFALGFEGAWLDMNEPSTGAVDPRDMRFDRGRRPHAAGRNLYALGMAAATRQGFAAAHPRQRPFLLSRAGSTGSQRFCAHWSGDNFSTYGHLRRSLGKALNLALSGVAFQGADVGGFGGDCPEPLLVDWFKAAFLLPFFRNHSMHGSRPQEPWARSRRALAIIRHYVRLRYALLPYLYNLFADHEERGTAVLRPLFHDFDGHPALPLGAIDDQFMVGPALMQAPFVQEAGRRRSVTLPGARWLRADTGRWTPGGRRLYVRRSAAATPLFVRDGHLIPFQPGTRTTNRTDLRRIGLLCALSPVFRGEARLVYRADDGISLDYREGRRTRLDITARREGRRLRLTIATREDGFGPVALTPYTVDRWTALETEVDGRRRIHHPQRRRVRLTGAPFDWYRWPAPGAA